MKKGLIDIRGKVHLLSFNAWGHWRKGWEYNDFPILQISLTRDTLDGQATLHLGLLGVGLLIGWPWCKPSKLDSDVLKIANMLHDAGLLGTNKEADREQ